MGMNAFTPTAFFSNYKCVKCSTQMSNLDSCGTGHSWSLYKCPNCNHDHVVGLVPIEAHDENTTVIRQTRGYMTLTTEYFGNSKLVSQHLAEQDTEIKPGDWYIAQRNGPPQILKCQSVNQEIGCIFPTQETPGYAFDIHECRAFKKFVHEETMTAFASQSRKEVLDWRESLKTP